MSTSLLAQNNLEDILKRLALNQALYIPEDILSSKSLVLFSVPEEDESSEWRERLDELQSFFALQGIDAMAYINQSELFPLPNQVLDIPIYLKDRKIEHLILLLIGANEEPMFLAIGPYNQEVNWWNPGSNFWVRNPVEWEPMFEELDIYFKSGTLNRRNFLVNDQPEFFTPSVENSFVFSSSVPRIKAANIQIALRALNVEFYNSAGPQIFSFEGLFNNELRLDILNQRKDALTAFAADSTNNVEIVAYNVTNRQLTRSGYDYELQYITGDFELLDKYFKSTKEREPFEGERTVFYLRDLRRNQIYFGKEWNPQEDWFAALDQFIEAFGSALLIDGL